MEEPKKEDKHPALFADIAKKIWESPYEEVLLIDNNQARLSYYFDLLKIELVKYDHHIEGKNFTITSKISEDEIICEKEQLFESSSAQKINKKITCNVPGISKRIPDKRFQVFLFNYSPNTYDAWHCRIYGDMDCRIHADMDPRKCEIFSIEYEFEDEAFAIYKFQQMKTILDDLRGNFTVNQFPIRDEYFIPTVLANYLDARFKPCFFFNDSKDVETFKPIFEKEYSNVHGPGRCFYDWYISPDGINNVIKHQAPSFILIHLSGVMDWRAVKTPLDRFMRSEEARRVYPQGGVVTVIVVVRPPYGVYCWFERLFYSFSKYTGSQESLQVDPVCKTCGKTL